MIRVVDASAVAAMLFGEPDGVWVHALLSGEPLFVPSIFHFELGNICRMKCRRHPDKAEELLTAWLDWNVQPPVTAIAIDPTTTMELARQHNLTFYDASYLWLAQDRASEIISLDAHLVCAARSLGLHAPSPTDGRRIAPRSRD
ncbi:MAG TPA: type II toxin-antitoxin system VapC family toxin [Acetobacteraceae bacterium]|jgi:predicted nucleic acid-binding protein